MVLRENPAADVARGAKPLEVEGVAKSIAGRVMSLAGGGQTLATAAAVEAFGVPREGLPGATVAVSHGWWQLKGVARPVEIFEIGVAGSTPFSPPPDSAKAWRVVRQGELWAPAREIPRSLPTERDSFVGRDQDLLTLGRRLDEGARLVTVLGMGGTGETRLVSRFAWTRLGEFPGGAWFCDLSEARSAEGITQAVARALEVPLGREEPVTLLGHAIAGRGKCLLLLDNFEQVARWAEETLGRWLDRTEEARFVVTTREVLGLPGETTLALAPMPAAESVQLFASRAPRPGRTSPSPRRSAPTSRPWSASSTGSPSPSSWPRRGCG